MASITPVPLVNLFACDRVNTVTTRITAEGPTAFAHTPFGHRSPDTAEDNGAGFNGQYQERDGAYLLGHGYRAYRPVLGRFTAPDSYSPFWGGGLNCYTYCRAEPVNRQDPSGHADDNTFNYVLIGLGIFAGVGGLGVTAFKSRFAGPGIGIAAGGILAAGTATMGLGSVDAGFKDRLNIAAILLLVGGAMVGGGTMFARRRGIKLNPSMGVLDLPSPFLLPRASGPSVPLQRTTSLPNLSASNSLSGINANNVTGMNNSLVPVPPALPQQNMIVQSAVGRPSKTDVPVSRPAAPKSVPKRRASEGDDFTKQFLKEFGDAAMTRELRRQNGQIRNPFIK